MENNNNPNHPFDEESKKVDLRGPYIKNPKKGQYIGYNYKKNINHEYQNFNPTSYFEYMKEKNQNKNYIDKVLTRREMQKGGHNSNISAKKSSPYLIISLVIFIIALLRAIFQPTNAIFFRSFLDRPFFYTLNIFFGTLIPIILGLILLFSKKNTSVGVVFLIITIFIHPLFLLGYAGVLGKILKSFLKSFWMLRRFLKNFFYWWI